MRHFNKLLSAALAGAMLFASVPGASAESSWEIQNRIEALEEEHSVIEDRLTALVEEEKATWDSTEQMIQQKNNIDEQMFLLYSEIENLDQQILEYRELISQNQQELDMAKANLEELNRKSKERIRAMEEGGKLSYWSVVFKANSFTDLVDRLNMVHEIAEADQKMLLELDQAIEDVSTAQEQLKTQKDQLEQSLVEQLAANEVMKSKRAQADEILKQLNAERISLEEDHKAVEEEKNELMAQIAQEEMEYNAAKEREEEERRRREEEIRQQQQSGNDTVGEDEVAPPSSTDTGWVQPCSYVYISSPYGQRGSGWHNGVDFAAYRGTPILATRSGTVTKARTMTTSYGNHVVVNHGDGYSSLYAHMEYFVVSPGQYVNQGEVIGYVGSTGNSTGPHLHFTIMYNGSDVNPMNYL